MLPIPDPGVKTAPDPKSGSATLVFISSGSSTYFWVLYMNPIPLAGVVLGQPDSHLCQLPLVLLLLQQLSVSDPGCLSEIPVVPGGPVFPHLGSQINNNKKGGRKNKWVVI